MDLDAPFEEVVPEEFWRRFQLGKPNLPEWYQSHKNIPLYKQQIERGESILKKLDEIKRSGDEPWIPSENDKIAIRRDIQQQIKVLRQTERPIMSRTGLIWED